MAYNLKIKQLSAGSRHVDIPVLNRTEHNTDLFIYEAQGIFLTGILQGYGRFSLPAQKPHDQLKDAFKATSNELQTSGQRYTVAEQLH